jgi:hypothetical protein
MEANMPNHMETLNALEKLAELKDKGILTEEEYQVKKQQIIQSDDAPKKIEGKGFPSSLFLLPILLGLIGGIIGAFIAAQTYKSTWWQLIAMGLIFSGIWTFVFVFIFASY